MAGRSRRFFVFGALGAGGALAVSGCSPAGSGDPGVMRSRGAEAIDARVDATLDFLFSRYPGTVKFRDRSVGMLVMPLVTEAGFFFGGAFGRGALRVRDQSVSYWSASTASFGLQIGAQQYSHVLFFMTQAALDEFAAADSITLGADLEFALGDAGGNVGGDTATVGAPVVALVFGQAGLMGGVSLKGTAYSRIDP